ncbi:MAG TPA: hypothetical protein DCS12_00610 [Clostridiales bacterium]|nr:hypothetical protein [Clostridiales bacterium]
MTNAYILGANKYLRLKGQAVVRRRKDGQQWQEEDYKKSNGWRSVKISEGNWNEICPDCVEFKKRLKAKGNINV